MNYAQFYILKASLIEALKVLNSEIYKNSMNKTFNK